MSPAPPPTRPLLRYLGGKWRLAPWIIGHFPRHDVYLEAFGGAAGVLLRKPPSAKETYNDLDDELVNLFKVLRGPDAAALIRLLDLTPYARSEYLAAFEVTDDPVERARRTIVRSHFAHGNMSLRRTRASGFRVDGVRAQTNVARNWADFPGALAAIIERIRAVTIEQKPALDLVDEFDAPGVLVYLDPPYLPDVRAKSHRLFDSAPIYRHEMSAEDHGALLDRCCQSQAMIVISGYPSPLYDKALAGWERRSTAARAYRNSARTEVVWINPAAAAALADGPLFAAA